MNDMTTASLLNKLLERNAADDGEALEEKIYPPQGNCEEIPTLDPSVVVRMTPMLETRFHFAGKWVNATGGLTWLSLSEMKDAVTNQHIQEAIRRRKENWQKHPLNLCQPSRLSLFGIDEEEYVNEIYLIWPALSEALNEPKVLISFNSNESNYANLNEFIYAWAHMD
jgi:hypothetical protein